MTILKFASLVLLCAALGLNAATVKLTWDDNSSDEDGFKIERAVLGGDFVVIATVTTDVVTFWDANVASGVSYVYRLRAFNAAGDSGYSNARLVVVPAAGVDAPPTTTVIEVKLG